MNQLVEVARADCLASLAWLCAFCRRRQGRQRRRAWCKARSQVSVRSQPKTNGFLLSPYEAGMVLYCTHDNFSVCLTPLGLSTFSTACGPGLFSSKTISGLVLSIQIFPHQSLTLGHTIVKEKNNSLSLCPFLLHSLGLYSCHNSKSPCNETLDFLLTDSRGNSH